MCLLTEQLIYYGNDEYEPKLSYVSSSDLPNLMREIFTSKSSWVDEVIVEQLCRIFHTYFKSQAFVERKKSIGDKSYDMRFISAALKRSKDLTK